MNNDEAVENFMAISSCNNHVKCVAFLADLENNLEVALESFYELSDAEKAEFFLAPQPPPVVVVRPPPPPPVIDLVGGGGGGMIEEPMVRKQLSLIEISLFRAHWKVTRRQDFYVAGSALASTWRLHLAFNESVLQTRPVSASAEMTFNETFSATLSSDNVGILLIELRNLMDVTLAMGGLEVSPDSIRQFSGEEGGVVRLSGEALEGQLGIRIALRLPPGAEARPKPRSKKLQRVRSASDVVEGSSMKKIGSSPQKKVLKVEPLAVQCKSCLRRKSYDSIVSIECGHPTSTCRKCFRAEIMRAIEQRVPDRLLCVDCGLNYTENDLSLVLTGVELDRFREVQLEQFLEHDDRIVRCGNPECRCPMEKMLASSRDLDQKANGPDGAPLSGAALRHYNEFRTRCPKCGSDFCSSCSVTPYHAGYTCQQLVEFKSASHCRFCNSALPARQRGDVCGSPECAEKMNLACKKKLACGHACPGVAGEPVCPPCLHEACDASGRGSEFCSICWVDGLSAAPVVMLGCGHFFHFACLRQKIDGKWPGLRITFGYMDCPLCKVRMSNPMLTNLMKSHEELYEKIRKNALNRLKVDGMLKDDRLVNPNSPYYQKEELYALHSFAYYNCFKCKQAYFGGRRNCEQNQVENRDPSEMVCFDCGDVPKVDCSKPKDHAEFHEWKCRFCCSIAIWFCWGTTHFCEPCHQKAYELKDKKVSELPKCPGKELCPLKCEHPPNGTEYSLGCGVCNNDAQLKKGGAKIDKDKEDLAEPPAPAQGGVAVAVAFVEGAVNMAKNAVRRSSRHKK